jgi:hypothetical protein
MLFIHGQKRSAKAALPNHRQRAVAIAQSQLRATLLAE